MGDFFAELQRRNIYRASATYAVVAWVLLQLLYNVAPVWVASVSLPLLVLGFPVAVYVAWTREFPAARAEAKGPLPTASKETRTANDSRWGLVEYSLAGDNNIRRIGNMNVEYSLGGDNKIRRIGNMNVEYSLTGDDKIWRIGDMTVEYSLAGDDRIRRIGDMNVEYEGNRITYIGNR